MFPVVEHLVSFRCYYYRNFNKHLCMWLFGDNGRFYICKKRCGDSLIHFVHFPPIVAFCRILTFTVLFELAFVCVYLAFCTCSILLLNFLKVRIAGTKSLAFLSSFWWMGSFFHIFVNSTLGDMFKISLYNSRWLFFYYILK